MEEENKLLEVAMEIILHAGDSRNHCNEAIEHAKKFDFEAAYSALENANKEIVRAHQAQTAVVQNEARGEKYDYSLLFNHAQDTLMTVMSEMNMTKNLVGLSENLYAMIERAK